MRTAIYLGIILGYVAGAAFDARAGDWKSATVAALFAVANGVIFFWR